MVKVDDVNVPKKLGGKTYKWKCEFGKCDKPFTRVYDGDMLVCDEHYKLLLQVEEISDIFDKAGVKKIF